MGATSKSPIRSILVLAAAAALVASCADPETGRANLHYERYW